MSSRYRSRQPRGLFVVVLFLILAAARYWYDAQEEPARAPDILADGPHRVGRVVDGDTLLLDNHARVRLIGVDTPETVKPNHPVEPWGPEATVFTRDFVGGGDVRLSFDKERLDRFDRFLAYVWVGDRMLNEELVRAGLARVELNFHYAGAMKSRFRRAEAEAREARRGLWSGSSP